MKHDQQRLLSEIKELNEILELIPEHNLIERSGFEARLKRAYTALETIHDYVEPERTRLTFRGSPVIESRSISADFGTKASAHFAEAFAAIIAGMRDKLRYMGPIPDKARNELAITGIATGSFGFEFELPNLDPNLFSESGGAEEALKMLLDILEKSALGTDDEVTDIVHAVHPRAIKKVVEFLDFMWKRDAWCGLEFKNHFFRYAGAEQVQAAKERLSEGNIKHTTEHFKGAFEGSLPKPRTFQFQPIDDDQPIIGRFDASIDPHALNRDWLEQPVTVQFDVVQVGQGRPRFTLLDLTHIKKIKVIETKAALRATHNSPLM
ncbi:hypothetical protein OEG84_08915 [Hoeflea sp. G2-23]|uniref:Uncharacterized protein n=1 Tax=Hoeflea algicola TaxID=2983763 RepID=A0ABT3Z923_9HYPH|nr:hypothetical protein [Hoeflea algicola]MCY0147829.1 hypothetical protein [Hoeflea algicola]